MTGVIPSEDETPRSVVTRFESLAAFPIVSGVTVQPRLLELEFDDRDSVTTSEMM